MSEFSFIKDPIRGNVFAIVVKSGDDAEIYPFSERAKSWANSQFGIDINPPDGMIMSEYRGITPKIKSLIAEIDKDSEIIHGSQIDVSKLVLPVYVHQKRVRIKASPYSSSKRINKFAVDCKNSIVDFKAKKFLSQKKRSEILSEAGSSQKNEANMIAVFGASSVRRANAFRESKILGESSTKRSARRVKSLTQNQEENTQISNRLLDSLFAKAVGFGAQ